MAAGSSLTTKHVPRIRGRRDRASRGTLTQARLLGVRERSHVGTGRPSGFGQPAGAPSERLRTMAALSTMAWEGPRDDLHRVRSASRPDHLRRAEHRQRRSPDRSHPSGQPRHRPCVPRALRRHADGRCRRGDDGLALRRRGVRARRHRRQARRARRDAGASGSQAAGRRPTSSTRGCCASC